MTSASKTTFLDIALELLSRAIDEEEGQNYQEAYAQYMAALDYLMAAEKSETNEKSKVLLKGKADEYLGRAETIKQRLEGFPGDRSSTQWSMATNDGVLRQATFTAQSVVLDEAFKSARQAVDADAAQNYGEAYMQYMKSMDYFMFAQRYELNEQSKSLIRAEVEEYLTRAELIKKHLKSLEEPRSNDAKPVNSLNLSKPPRSPQVIFLHTAVDISELAVQHDIKQDFTTAYELYNDALDYFILAQKYERNEKSRVVIRANIEEYLTRAEALKKFKFIRS